MDFVEVKLSQNEPNQFSVLGKVINKKKKMETHSTPSISIHLPRSSFSPKYLFLFLCTSLDTINRKKMGKGSLRNTSNYIHIYINMWRKKRRNYPARKKQIMMMWANKRADDGYVLMVFIGSLLELARVQPHSTLSSKFQRFVN